MINRSLLHSGSITLLIIIVVRLDATEQFGGHIANLDFGEKSNGGGDNIAFTPGWTTYGHCLQGILASLLSYPAVVGLIARIRIRIGCGGSKRSDAGGSSNSILLTRPSVAMLLLCQLASAVMTIYPTYSLIKRLHKSYDYFAQSSHLNNTTEWILGYVLGVGIGWLVTTLVERSFLVLAGLSSRDEDGNDESKLSIVSKGLSVSESDVTGTARYGFGIASEYKESISPVVVNLVSGLCALILGIFSIGVLLTGVFTARTWNFDEYYGYRSNDDMTAVFVAVYVIVLAAMTFFSLRK